MKLIWLTFFNFIAISFADVRVYQYVVINKVEIIENPTKQIMTSTLNPTAFISYHGGENVINVDLLRTWMCYGHTGSKRLCPPPMSKLEPGVLP